MTRKYELPIAVLTGFLLGTAVIVANNILG